jgi:enoyl-CoA hydratase/carnithine racemase
MLLGAAVLDAAEMHRRGFLNQVLPQADLQTEVERRLKHMATLAPQAARMNKQTLRALTPWASAPASTDGYRYADSREHREGIDAFLAKRPPNFD